MLDLFIRTFIPFMRVLLPCPCHIPKPLPPNTITLGVKFQHTNLGKTQTFRPQQISRGQEYSSLCSVTLTRKNSSNKESIIYVFIIYYNLTVENLEIIVNQKEDSKHHLLIISSSSQSVLTFGVQQKFSFPQAYDRQSFN